MATQNPTHEILTAQDLHAGIRLPLAAKDVLSNDSSFEPHSSFTTVEIISTTDKTQCKVDTLVRDAASVCAWLGQKMVAEEQDLSYRMKLLICERFTETSTVFPITMDRETFSAVCTAMKLPPNYVSLIPQHNGRFLRIYGPDIEGFILHMRNPGFSFITTYDHSEKTIYGLILGTAEKDIKKLVGNIETSDLTCWPPVLVSICLLELKFTWIEESLTVCYKKLVNTEKSVGTFTDFLLKPKDVDREWLQKLDFEPLARDLTIISTSIARSDHACAIAQNMIRVIEESYDSYLEDLKNVGIERARRAQRSRNSAPNTGVLTRVSELKSSFQVLLLECQFYLRRTEANRQTIYSLIAQKDNLITTRIAEYSLEENQNMKAIAEYSLEESQNMKIIAEANTRDSAAMVVISIVTIVFLPGTFVSSLFSTTIFNFQSDDGGVVKEHWHGIYWAITAPITLAILTGAFLFWKLRYSREKERRKTKAVPKFDPTMSRAHTVVRFDTHPHTTAGASLVEKRAATISEP